MSWKESDRVSERREFVELASNEGANFAVLCRRFGVSRKTGYKWLGRFREGGVEALADRSRRPLNSPRRTSREVEELVLSVRDEHPTWCGRKIRARLQHLGHEAVPAASTITAILHRHGRITQQASDDRQHFTRFERTEPNDLWQIDFKGEFRMTNQAYCYPLTVLDDHSRYVVGLEACGRQTHDTVKDRLRGIFRRYGLPRTIYADNGVPWGSRNSPGGHTRLTAWLMRLDVRVIHGRPYHSQGRGKDERFHRTLKQECLQQRRTDDLSDAQQQFDPFRAMYNHERPHEALDLNVPASRYLVSPRSFPESLPEYEYSSRFETRRTNPVGQFSFGGRVFKTSEAFQNDTIGLASTNEPDVFEVYYRRFPIGVIDFKDPRSRINSRNRTD